MANEITTYQDFEGELEQRADSFAAMLPAHVDHDRFKANAVAAVRQTPALLKCTKRSLFGAITRSAQDGLMPDGREGVINVYKTKQANGQWQETAQWIPMTHGLRKRAKEIDGIIVDAQVVHAGDHFQYRRGDDPHIDHVPAPLGTPRGEMVGAYAIFKAADGTVLHREVMDAEQIERVRSQSKQPDGLMWSKFTEEAWRKTVIRRGFKSVPCSERLQEVVRRDDELFDFDEQPGLASRRQPARIVQASPSGQRRPPPPLVGGGRPMPRFSDPAHQAAFDAQAPLDDGEPAGMTPEEERLVDAAWAQAEIGGDALDRWCRALSDADAALVEPYLAGPKKRAQEIDGVTG